MVRTAQQGFGSRLRRARKRWVLAGALGAGLIVAGVAQGALSFSSHDYTIPAEAFGVLAGHFNGDQKLDLVAVGHDANIYYLQGKANGAFADPVATAIPGDGWGGVAGDFNGDGNLDVFVADISNSKLVLMRGKGDGTFKAPQSFQVGNGPQSPAAADFNRDGRLDVAVADNGGHKVSVLLGKRGGFKSADTYRVHGEPYAVATGRINSDRLPDIVSADDSGNSVSVLLAKPNGTFGRKKVTADPGAPEDVTVGDFNGDGKADVATGQCSHSNVAILRGLGTGKFKPPKTFPAEASACTWHIDAGFINGDRKLDVVAGNESSPGGVSVFLGHGDGTLGPQTDLDSANSYSPVVIGNFDGQNGGDIAAAHDEGGVTVFLNQG